MNLQGEFQAGRIGETEVQDHQIGMCEAENLPSLVGGSSRDRGVAHILQHLASMAAGTGFVIDHKNERHDQTYTGHESRAGASGLCALESLLQRPGDGLEQRLDAERFVEGGHRESVWADGMREVVEVENRYSLRR